MKRSMNRRSPLGKTVFSTQKNDIYAESYTSLI
jgi:hypothetical protein